MNDTLHILVVDDEPGMRAGVERALRDFRVVVHEVGAEYHCAVRQASSGEEALAILNGVETPELTPPVDILLLDHKLPGMTGLDVLDQVVGKVENMVTVMITAYASLETAVGAIKRGAYDFLAKPFTPMELKATVRKAAVSLILARQARKLAEEKRQVRFQFISVLAHELKAPLAAVEGYLQILRDRSAGADQAAYDQMIERSLVRTEGMRKLIADLLDLTRIESGQRKRELAEVDLTDVARSAVELVAAQADERQITVRLLTNRPVNLQADRSEMEIILNNLLSNAVKYNRPGGRVDVNVTVADGEIVLRVADTGIGMTAEECLRLFNDFVRIKNTKTRDILGSGLGLSIVKKLAHLYGGTASVTSTPDVGSTFTVTLRPPPAGQEKTS